MLSFQQGLSDETVRIIADSCRHLEKLGQRGLRQIDDDDVIHVIIKLGKQLTAQVLLGKRLADVAC
jgi:hypothetical protein